MTDLRSSSDSAEALAAKVERIAHMMRMLLDKLPFCDPDIKDLEQAAAALRSNEASNCGADAMVGEVEKRFPDWKGFRDLIDCIDVTLHRLREPKQNETALTNLRPFAWHYEQETPVFRGERDTPIYLRWEARLSRSKPVAAGEYSIRNIMKVEINGQQIHPRRGGPVEVGNVYGNAYGKPFFRLVVGVMHRVGERPWRNVVCIRLDTAGNIVGCATEPEAYVREHQDLIGRVNEMPNMKIDWFREPQKTAAEIIQEQRQS